MEWIEMKDRRKLEQQFSYSEISFLCCMLDLFTYTVYTIAETAAADIF